MKKYITPSVENHNFNMLDIITLSVSANENGTDDKDTFANIVAGNSNN